MTLRHLAAFVASVLPVIAAMKQPSRPDPPSLAAVGPLTAGQQRGQQPQQPAVPQHVAQQQAVAQQQGDPLPPAVQQRLPPAQAMQTQGDPLPPAVQQLPPAQAMQVAVANSLAGREQQPVQTGLIPGVVPGGAVPQQFATQARLRYERDNALAASAQVDSVTPPPPIEPTLPPMARKGNWQTQLRMPSPAQPAVVAEDNAMANTYGFLRTSSNRVGSVVENVLGVEGSLDDMHKDLDEEYKRWMMKKKVLLSQRDKMKSEISRAKAALLEQKQMREEKERVVGRIQIEQGQNKKRADDIKESALKWKFEKQQWDDEINVIQCQTANIERIKQERVEAANKQTSILKDHNRVLQTRVFELNKELNQLVVDFSDMKIRNNATVSGVLSKIEAVQKEIQALEAELLQQAQLEEAVQRARERVAAQQHEVVKQRVKITEAQSKCNTTQKQLDEDVETAKRNTNDANGQMIQCQELDAANQKLQAEVNECVVKKRSLR